VKAVVTQQFACSYTGVADLGSDTADWLACHLSDKTEEPDGGILTIALAAENELARRRLSGEPLAVVCVGWTERDGAFIPLATVVSNLGPSGVEKTFSVQQVAIAPGRMSAVFPIGQLLTPSELANVNRAVRQLCVSERDTARAVAQVLTELIRGVAQGDDRGFYVSEDVLVTSLPRPDLLSGGLVVGRLVEDWWSVTNILGGETRVERHGGPIVVGRKAAIQALPPEDGPPGEGVNVAMRIVRKPEDDGSLEAYILTDPPLGAAWGWPGT
jgi:hypothetical protein